MANTQITAHMIVKNEDVYIWYAIMSIIDYVDKILIFDTGSKDKTVNIIKSIKSSKIHFKQIGEVTADKLVSLREEQLKMTQTPWVWVVDGDEVYPENTVIEVLKNTQKKEYLGGIVRRYDLLGDIYHYQSENVGTYSLVGERGHLVLRLLNTAKINRLHLKGVYPNEGYYDDSGKAIIEYPKKDFFITKGRLFHAMYLKRSSLGASLINTLHRNKYKIESGYLFSATEEFPSVFFKSHPTNIPDVTSTRDIRYDILAKGITPLKKIKRKFF